MVLKSFFHACLLLLAFGLYGQHQKDSTELEAYMDGVMQTLLSEKNIAGATLAIIRGDEVLLKKGYGFADYERQLPVDPDKTIFRIGSITKLFVWTSVMRLVAEGKLDLNTDINTYLKDFKIPEAYGEPVTLKHLMTHTPGFEDRLLNLFSLDSTALRPLGELLRDDLPERVRPPFTQASYSNHGTAIAAYIVEQVTGMPFNDYAERYFLQPLGMKSTTLRQPVPSSLAPYQSKGYQYKQGYISKPFEYIPLYPAGAAGATASDMIHWMQTYLNHGKYGDYTLVDSATLALMMSDVKRHHPNTNTMHYGFMDMSMNGVHVIGHGGDTFWFHSIMALIPEERVGVFVSFNTYTGGGAYSRVLRAFMERYYPDQRPLPPALPVNADWLSAFAGEYRLNRYPHSDVLKIASLFSIARMQVTEDNRLRVDMNGETNYYVPIDSTTFRKEHSNETFAFERNDRGEVIHAYEGLLAVFAFDKVTVPEASSTHLTLFMIIILTALGTVVYWPAVALIRRNHVRNMRVKKPLPLLPKIVAWLTYFFYLLFFILFLSSLGDPQNLIYGLPTALKVGAVFPMLSMITTVGMAWMLIQLFRERNISPVSIISYLVLLLISVLALWQLNYWNMLGFL
ncbi:MAG: beta-lactamase family protein [Cyclobacteriaceae bacterium]|jgi:CubicO group peptidase (beta-lactamase class C family)|nr:beta-lactamase family protein [Cyclobacteriaceae bacterium]